MVSSRTIANTLLLIETCTGDLARLRAVLIDYKRFNDGAIDFLRIADRVNRPRATFEASGLSHQRGEQK